ncbi:inactive protein RESTRICTED TEV MOVEMENT 2-like isoform X2 [Mangifera indica]|uniref:inactive protein RESTRICTED TEV MOVEMENT 2-like isoform X2 n=1 Tax=Mangifera indica TaxID=29780 RepID=UPI001CFADF21|nr:inactive protein RESTRICTED TEV MOVEMENT 2-like isoform X2 [Mangifera indica]
MANTSQTCACITDPRLLSYEDFHPSTEFNEGKDNFILTLHLPGFTKEQLKVTRVRGSYQIRIKVEPQFAIYKWRRFNQIYTIPQNCNLDKIEARLQNSVLTITMPKKPQPAVETKSQAETISKELSMTLSVKEGLSKELSMTPSVETSRKLPQVVEIVLSQSGSPEKEKNNKVVTICGDESMMEMKRIKDAAMKAVKGLLIETEEERQTNKVAVAVGVAALVVVGIGAYVALKIGSKATSN